MALKLTLKPGERVVVNGCVIRNSDRRHVITIENRADIVRGHDLLEADGEVTPVRKVYFLIQSVLIQSELRDTVVPLIQRQLAALVTVFGQPSMGRIFEAANFVSQSDYYKAMRALRPVLDHEQEVLSYARAGAAMGDPTPDATTDVMTDPATDPTHETTP
ncbi:flagellum biosynthesis protein FlbT [Mesobaculum littorinae]|uniref:Flagellum biosynthesis protein FlbT n=1 Tax=Mesobaculum littorinae TaxID=2486419 RepID=A0A438ADU3_9RHOB|nr:flagellar biosynthesis repressor FlbT [Mesobaculum littorinae]RVV96870.1 flagellum biosynthesis protein FlbT [Mesobaculum littorinae]